jgi:hypothetical protein
MNIFDHDLKEAISGVKRDEYRKVMGNTLSPMVLIAIERRIRTDSQLTRDDRMQLLGDVERFAALVG